MHAVFSVGALLAPVASRPFLSVEVADPDDDAEVGDPDLDLDPDPDPGRFTESHVGTAYLFSGACLLAASLGFLFLGIRHLVMRRHRGLSGQGKRQAPAEVAAVYGRREKLIILLATVGVLFFLGGEFGIFNFLPAFAVKSNLGLTKAQGVSMLAVYFITYALSRISCFFLTFWSVRVSQYPVGSTLPHS